MKGIHADGLARRKKFEAFDHVLFEESWDRRGLSNRIFLMAKDESTVFTYWTLDETRRQLTEKHFQSSWANLPFFLQVYDVTHIHFNGDNAHTVRRISVQPDADNWYVYDVLPRRNYIVDFGTLTWNGNFFTLLRSNVIETPRETSFRDTSSEVRFAPRFAAGLAQNLQPSEVQKDLSHNNYCARHEASAGTRQTSDYPYQEEFDGYTIRESEKVRHS